MSLKDWILWALHKPLSLEGALIVAVLAVVYLAPFSAHVASPDPADWKGALAYLHVGLGAAVVLMQAAAAMVMTAGLLVLGNPLKGFEQALRYSGIGDQIEVLSVWRLRLLIVGLPSSWAFIYSWVPEQPMVLIAGTAALGATFSLAVCYLAALRVSQMKDLDELLQRQGFDELHAEQDQ